MLKQLRLFVGILIFGVCLLSSCSKDIEYVDAARLSGTFFISDSTVGIVVWNWQEGVDEAGWEPRVAQKDFTLNILSFNSNDKSYTLLQSLPVDDIPTDNSLRAAVNSAYPWVLFSYADKAAQYNVESEELQIHPSFFNVQTVSPNRAYGIVEDSYGKGALVALQSGETLLPDLQLTKYSGTTAPIAFYLDDQYLYACNSSLLRYAIESQHYDTLRETAAESVPQLISTGELLYGTADGGYVIESVADYCAGANKSTFVTADKMGSIVDAHSISRKLIYQCEQPEIVSSGVLSRESPIFIIRGFESALDADTISLSTLPSQRY